MRVDPARQFASPYNGMGNDPINGVDPDGALFGGGNGEGFLGMLVRRVFSGGKSSLSAGSDLEITFDEEQAELNGTISEYVPSLADNWSNSSNIFASLSYGIADGFYVAGHFFAPWREPRHLNGDWATPNERVGAFATASSFIFTGSGGSAASSSRAFWSGTGSEVRALGHGFGTLGRTRAGQNLMKLTEGMPYYPAMNGQPASQAYQWWARLSTQYAKGASGKVHVFQNAQQGVGMQSIWRLYEYPALMKNPNVTGIIFH